MIPRRKGVQKKEHCNGEQWEGMKETLEKTEIYFTDVVLLYWRSVSPKKKDRIAQGDLKFMPATM